MKNVDQFKFEDETGSFYSCSATIHGQMMIFGGYGLNYKTQISTVESCRLRRVGTLPMDFYLGACNTFETSGGTEETLLCFAEGGYKLCHRWLRTDQISFESKFSYQGNVVSSAPSSTYEHYATSLGRFENRPMAVGSYPNKKLEERRNGFWLPLNDFPFVNRYIAYYSTVNFNKALYLFGIRFFSEWPFSIYYLF